MSRHFYYWCLDYFWFDIVRFQSEEASTKIIEINDIWIINIPSWSEFNLFFLLVKHSITVTHFLLPYTSTSIYQYISSSSFIFPFFIFIMDLGSCSRFAAWTFMRLVTASYLEDLTRGRYIIFHYTKSQWGILYFTTQSRSRISRLSV